MRRTILKEDAAQNIDLNNAKDVDIKDSNVKILISTGESKKTDAQGKGTDYVSLGIIVAIILALAAYFLLTGDGTQINE
jgi:hypothetical protein